MGNRRTPFVQAGKLVMAKMLNGEYDFEFGPKVEQSKTSNPVIYFARAADLGIKIGFSNGNIHQRLKELETYCPVQLELLGAIPGNREKEKCLHEKFKDHRIKGEWFAIHEDILVYIAKHGREGINGDGG
jgi:hypothetical protein